MGFDQQIQFASAMSQNFADAAGRMVSASSSLWAHSEPKETQRSWYREPAANPFDWSAWGLPFAGAAQPWSAWGFSQPSMFQSFTAVPFAYQPWPALASFASSMAALQQVPSYVRAFDATPQQPDYAGLTWQAMMWPLTQASAQLATFAAAVAVPNEYSSYRSDGGHAVAQIVAAEPLTPEWPLAALFGWGSTAVH